MNEITEAKINEWTSRSLKEGICGVVNCFKKPTTHCPKCLTIIAMSILKRIFI
jgi:hypothetical protein